ncbi:tyrosine-type recombinase/integrase [Stenotrophomonas sp. S39]|uniref:tyrosine-type recombinase/integrase n=1 Tax=Stenotrophomonas sp. S39 TaxID=2767451 RepID=UPI00190B660A|nr:tyrosine-type recombinase/integrase [Stenotrophomonas sp. S39]MBK0052631.1 tyrosine-type recombinase/integrase [Stenotrophomonas sp. S39]
MSGQSSPVELLGIASGLAPELVDPDAGAPRLPAGAQQRLPHPSSAFEAIQVRLQAWEVEYERAKSRNTIKALRDDWASFTAWCGRARTWSLPVTPGSLVRFLGDQVVVGKKAATLHRYISSIRTVHKAAGLRSPTDYPDWALDWQALLDDLTRFNRAAPDQATPLTREHVAQIHNSLGSSLLDLRDAALLGVAADTLCRESELTQLRLEDFQCTTSGWIVRVSTARAGRSGGRIVVDERDVSDESKAAIDAWCDAAAITEGFLFVPLGRSSSVNPATLDRSRPIRPKQVARIIRHRALKAGVPGAASMSGHSARAGSAMDMIENGATVHDVQLAGGWRSQETVLRYAEAVHRSWSKDNVTSDDAELRKSVSRRKPGRGGDV